MAKFYCADIDDNIVDLPIYNSAAPGTVNGDRTIRYMDASNTIRYCQMYKSTDEKATGRLHFYHPDGFIYINGYAYTKTTVILSEASAIYTVPAGALFPKIEVLHILGGGGAGGVQGGNWTGVVASVTVTYYGGGGGGGGHGYKTYLENIALAIGDTVQLIRGAGGILGSTNGGQSQLKINSTVVQTANGGYNGTSGATATGAGHGSGGPAGAGDSGTGITAATNGASGTSGGKGANGTGATGELGGYETTLYGVTTKGNGGSAVSGQVGGCYAKITYLTRVTPL